tara:strand:- start:32 stop:493 length:462 start_codon:yes stop_codon:yes gene_type:complete
MDIYKRELSSNEIILLYLKEKLNHNIDVCKLILDMKLKTETKEINEYYIDRWENIAGSHYILHDTHYGKYSLIYDENNYIVKPDHKLNFYKLTGISYQIIELIHELIKIIDGPIGDVMQRSSVHSFIEDYKYWLKYDDKLYSILAKKITEIMK